MPREPRRLVCRSYLWLIKFQKADVELMFQCAKHHYDSYCKHFAHPDVGMLTNMRKHPSQRTKEMDFRTVDTLCKILEPALYGKGDSPTMQRAYQLTKFLKSLLREGNALTQSDLDSRKKRKKMCG